VTTINEDFNFTCCAYHSLIFTGLLRGILYRSNTEKMQLNNDNTAMAPIDHEHSWPPAKFGNF
jgi:hypothetical protein